MKKYNSLNEVELAINRNCAFAEELENLVLKIEDDEEKLELISFVGKIYSELVTGKYSSSFLEMQIIDIGKKISFQRERPIKTGKILHVMSQAYNIGGHTVIANNWINWDVENSSSLVMTDMYHYQVPSFLRESVRRSGGEVYTLTGDYVTKARRLLEIAQDYEYIVLHTHMHDVVPVLAFCNKNWDRPVYFYNHADFRFSYGFSVSDVVLNMMAFDKEKSEKYRGAEINEILQFPGAGKSVVESKKSNVITNKKALADKYGFSEEKPLIISMGADYKYNSIIGIEFDKFVISLLNNCEKEVYFLIIGADKENTKWKQMETATLGQAKALGTLPRDEVAQLIGCADVYVTSFPMCGSGVAIAKEANVPSVSLNLTGRAPELLGDGCASTVEELEEQILQILDGEKDRYLRNYKTQIWDREEWLRRKNEIVKQNTIHRLRLVNTKRCVGKQEIVNCQLMQEEGIKRIRNYIQNPKLERYLDAFVELDQEYKIGIFEDKTIIPNKQDLQKEIEVYKRRYFCALLWAEARRREKYIAEYLKVTGNKSVAIYGLDYLGQELLEELNADDVVVKYVIDKRLPRKSIKQKCYLPEEEIEKVDLIINCTMEDDYQLAENLRSKDDIKVISLDRLLDEVVSYESRS